VREEVSLERVLGSRIILADASAQSKRRRPARSKPLAACMCARPEKGFVEYDAAELGLASSTVGRSGRIDAIWVARINGVEWIGND
jgi:hypothetical protein